MFNVPRWRRSTFFETPKLQTARSGEIPLKFVSGLDNFQFLHLFGLALTDPLQVISCGRYSPTKHFTVFRAPKNRCLSFFSRRNTFFSSTLKFQIVRSGSIALLIVFNPETGKLSAFLSSGKFSLKCPTDHFTTSMFLIIIKFGDLPSLRL